MQQATEATVSMIKAPPLAPIATRMKSMPDDSLSPLVSVMLIFVCSVVVPFGDGASSDAFSH